MSTLRAALVGPQAQELRCLRTSLSPKSTQLCPDKRSRQVSVAVMADRPPAMLNNIARPDADGRFGKFGGKYVPETLIPALLALTEEYEAAMKDEAFQVRTGSMLPSTTTHRRSTRLGHTYTLCMIISRVSGLCDGAMGPRLLVAGVASLST